MTGAEPPDVPRRLARAEQVLASRTRRVAVVLESAQDPHNVHAVLRTAEALGLQDVHLVAPRGAASSISPGVTQRAHEWLTLRRHETVGAAVAALRSEGRVIVAAANDAEAEPLTGFACARPCAVLLGNETEGLSQEALRLADRRVRIDLVGFSGSLNLSVAAAITLWELRRVEVASERPGDLDDEAATALRREWYERLFQPRPGAAELAERWVARKGEVLEAARAMPRVIPPSRNAQGRGSAGPP